MVEFRAGKMHFEGNKVVPDTRKGLIRIARVCMHVDIITLFFSSLLLLSLSARLKKKDFFFFFFFLLLTLNTVDPFSNLFTAKLVTKLYLLSLSARARKDWSIFSGLTGL